MFHIPKKRKPSFDFRVACFDFVRALDFNQVVERNEMGEEETCFEVKQLNGCLINIAKVKGALLSILYSSVCV